MIIYNRDEIETSYKVKDNEIRQIESSTPVRVSAETLLETKQWYLARLCCIIRVGTTTKHDCTGKDIYE